MKFARWVFWIAGAYGLVALVPQYFYEAKFSADYPPAITHPEFYYGFAGVAIAWQIAFLIIGHDPLRFRPIMLPAVVEKFSFTAAAVVLFLQDRIPELMLAGGLVDGMLGILFIIAWIRVGSTSAMERTS